MNLRLILPAAASALLAASCTPYVEPPPEPPADPAQRKQLTPEEQEKINKQREEKRKREEELKAEGTNTQPDGETPKVEPTTPDGGGEKAPAPPKPANEKKEAPPVARPIPGKPGFVFSPFNNKPIDVKGFPPGSLVADPTYPASEKKHFRVP
ncbi:hypothetical protein [Luteolibacter luteus]|uniref:Uncharacterized protein n=1 Tax=Luteolibacter luteus TaxID=2728835 RepID=A0A858RE52_9BACT|nr:hypothetical protein [Luteolibacter luteus]QJE94600.1 hypothetical protein HHL09_01980 [Luteolibacter luteus]